MNQWLALKGDDRLVFAKREARKGALGTPGAVKLKEISCFLCGSMGHMARDCRTRKEDSPRSGEKGEKVEKTPKAGRTVTCFVCGEIGHKSPSCPQRRDKAAKRVVTRQTEPEVLGENDLLESVDGCSFPATLDTGASITLLPKEFVKKEALTGETEQVRGFRRDAPFQTAPVAEVSIQVGACITLRRRTAVLDGETLGWKGSISIVGHR